MKNLVPIVLTLLALASYCRAAELEQPNVVVILTDDQGWADIGFNNPNVYTPNMDRLAAEGMILSQHYVMPQCTPTRLALFTGRYPGRFGTTGLQAANGPMIPHRTMTLASLLRDRGYQTYMTGKWHMGSTAEHGPNHHGFDYSYGGLAGAVGAYVHMYRAPQLENPYKITWHRNHEIIPGYENGKHVTDLVTDDAIRVIKRPRDEPFFLYLPYFAPHTPLDERGQFVKIPTQLDGDNPGRWLNEDKIKWFNDPNGIIQKESDPERRLFLAVLHHLDHAVGRVVQAIDDSGQRDNTVIFFSADNGPQVNWGGGSYPSDLRLTDFNQPIPFRGEKSQVYEGGIRVPGFVNWRGKIKPGKSNAVHHIVDWLPTIAAITGKQAAAPDDQPRFDGVDFSPELLGNATESSPRAIYSLHRQKPDKWALRNGDWKVVYYGKSEPKPSSWQLFNLTEDLAEQHDVAAEYPETVRQLHQQFLAHRAKDRKEPNYPFTALEFDPSQEPWLAKYAKQQNAPKPSEQLINTDEEPNLLRSGFKPLFNGSDLTGWTPRGGTCTFEARDGAIIGTCVPGSESTYLCSDRSDFKNFIFTCDIYWHIDSNTGVQFRGQVRTDSKGREVVFGPQAEMEGFEKDRGWSGGIYGQSCGGYFYPLWLKQHARARKALRKDDWNRITVSADKGVVKTWINGAPAAHWIDDGTYREGFFGLQIHKGKQGQVSFRNIRVKELN